MRNHKDITGRKEVKALGFTRNSDKSYGLNLKINSDNYHLVKQLAIKYDVPVIKNPALVKVLKDLPVNHDLPMELVPILDVILNLIEDS